MNSSPNQLSSKSKRTRSSRTNDTKDSSSSPTSVNSIVVANDDMSTVSGLSYATGVSGLPNINANFQSPSERKGLQAAHAHTQTLRSIQSTGTHISHHSDYKSTRPASAPNKKRNGFVSRLVGKNKNNQSSKEDAITASWKQNLLQEFEKLKLECPHLDLSYHSTDNLPPSPSSKTTVQSNATPKKQQSTPLHIALHKHYSSDLILHHLLHQSPHHTTQPNEINDYPLHSAMRDTSSHNICDSYGQGTVYGVETEVANAIIDLYPHAVKVRNYDGCLPLHLACESGAPNGAVVQRLVALYPESVMMTCQLAIPFDSEAKRFISKTPYDADDEDEYEERDAEEEEEERINRCFWPNLPFFQPFASTSQSGVSLLDTRSVLSKDPHSESELTPLHLAVLHKASPDVLHTLLDADPYCIHIPTSQGRTALDIAKSIVIDQVASNSDISAVKNTFAAIEILQTISKTMRKMVSLQRTSMITKHTLHGMGKFQLSQRDEEIRKQSSGGVSEVEWKRMMKNVEKMKKMKTRKEREGVKAPIARLAPTSFFSRMTQSSTTPAVTTSTKNNSTRTASSTGTGSYSNNNSNNSNNHQTTFSSLGPMVEMDNLPTKSLPENFSPPENLTHVCVDIDLPVGFQRLRWAICSVESDFWSKALLEDRMKYTDIEMEPWDKYRNEIGKHTNYTHTNDSDDSSTTTSNVAYKPYQNATRKLSYLMPKAGVVPANKAYETITIHTYNDHCFALKRITSNPNVPFGTTFSTHSLVVFTRDGRNRCKMTASAEAVFDGKPPMVAWKIRNMVYSGTTDFYVAEGKAICHHATE